MRKPFPALGGAVWSREDSTLLKLPNTVLRPLFITSNISRRLPLVGSAGWSMAKSAEKRTRPRSSRGES